VTAFVHRVCAEQLQTVACPSLCRVGSANDGGYVVALDALAKARLLLSFGIATNWEFEADAATRNPQLRVDAYDHSVGMKFFAEMAMRAGVNAVLRLLTLNAAGAAASARKLRVALSYFRFFSRPHRHTAKRVWYNTDRGSAAIGEIIDAAETYGPLSVFAKIDIEGSEYRVLPAVAARAHLFSGLVVEFHDTDICADAFNAAIASLARDFDIVHVHGNNYGDMSADGRLPLTLEVSFVNRALGTRGEPGFGATNFPRLGLDAPNNPRVPDYAFEL